MTLRLVDGVATAQEERRGRALALAEAALRAVDPEGATAEALRDLNLPRDAFVLAVGKAAVPMVRAAARALPKARGVVVGPEAVDVPGFTSFVGGHPLPREDAALAGQVVLDAARALGPADVALCLVSGGGSAMLELPAEGASLAQIRETTQRGLRGGMPIEELNRRRIELSALKGGKLAAAMAPARIVNVLLSDVPGAEPSVIASGPTWVDDAEHVIAADNQSAQDALVESGAALGLRLVRFRDVISGEAAVAGEELMRRAAALLDQDQGVDGVVAGGETTVTVMGGGQGGRNGELVAGAIRHLGDHLLLSLATDGVDGPGGGAGALIDAAGVRLGTTLAGPVEWALQDNDTGRWFRTAGLQLAAGATGTNVADLHLVLR
ncbi:MAG: glycerate-2-kinase family protein [Deltaproteobacteria bacterium]|nr:glycerate-2-kinase family protein [Deltaproteobacteria bacterium]